MMSREKREQSYREDEVELSIGPVFRGERLPLRRRSRTCVVPAPIKKTVSPIATALQNDGLCQAHNTPRMPEGQIRIADLCLERAVRRPSDASRDVPAIEEVAAGSEEAPEAHHADQGEYQDDIDG
jgi:hypothetical protein